MTVRNLVRSARGTSENPGTSVGGKRGLSRALAGAAPGEQRAELKAACDHHGSRYAESPARNSSVFCPQCHHCSPENRKSQAVFRCTKCGHSDNADANAARNHLLWATSAKPRAAVRRSWGESPKRQADRGNPDRATKAKGTRAPRRRNPGPGATRSSERSPPPGINPGSKAGASEAATNAEADRRRNYC